MMQYLGEKRVEYLAFVAKLSTSDPCKEVEILFVGFFFTLLFVQDEIARL